MTCFRKGAAIALLTAMLVGWLEPAAALAQAEPAPASPAQPARSDTVGTQASAASHVDGYDVGAAAINVVWVPFKIGVCGVSSGLAALAFIATLGTGRDWSASVFEEGCVHKWLIQGDDFRPASPQPPPGNRELRP